MAVSKRKALKLILIITVIVLVAYVVGYVSSVNSDAYREAKQFVMQSTIVEAEFGKDLEITLAPFGYKLEFSGKWGAANFVCYLKGSKKNGEVKIYLDKGGEKWQVKKALLLVGGKVVNLQPREIKIKK